MQQIKIMQSLQGGVSKNYFQNSYQVSQCKQKIATLQKQINVQQALLFKQQQMQQQQQTAGNRPTAMMNNNNLGSLANDLSNLQITQQNQSRLNQWKLPSNYDKDELSNYQDATGLPPNTPNDGFSRAPGPSSKQQAQQFISPQNSWTNPMAGADDNWQNKNQLSSSAPQQQLMNPNNNNYGEMVNDFTANKQWKDTMQQMNNNPQAFSNLVTGDVKDQMYNWSAANKLVDSNDNLANASNTFNSSTWTFSNSNSQLAAAAATSQNANIWTNNNQTATTANNGSNKPMKGPPPGLAQVQKDLNQNSSFLLIRNLTLQVSLGFLLFFL